MKIEDVRKLPPMQRFIYWITERHLIYLRRFKQKRKKPWTDDIILQTQFFTNPYREHDKVTIWFRENIRGPLADDPIVAFSTIAFRWFNLPATGELLLSDDDSDNLFINWNEKEAIQRLTEAQKAGKKLFTNAYIIASKAGMPKHVSICKRITNVWKDRDLFSDLEQARSLERAHKVISQYEGIGPFMAYEVVCDLRYTWYLENAKDILTWANPGPGAYRGLARLLGIDVAGAQSIRVNNPVRQIRELREEVEADRGFHRVRLGSPEMSPAIEMREIEHSLCEWDKYERCLWETGRSKRTYKGA